jgi:DNA-directed RNA polymerase specialized sigma24 family protein
MIDRRERHLVIEARENGWSWEQIAEELGLTRQGVRSRYKDLPPRLNQDGEVDQ